MILDTGQLCNPGQSSGLLQPGFVPPSSASAILFSADLPHNSKTSPQIRITFRDMLLVDAYQVPEGKKIFLNRLVVGTRPIPPLSPGAIVDTGRLTRGGTLLFSKRMDLNGLERWEMSAERTMLFLTVPGLYEFELEDESMVENMYVEITWFQVERPIPKDFFGGIL